MTRRGTDRLGYRLVVRIIAARPYARYVAQRLAYELRTFGRP